MRIFMALVLYVSLTSVVFAAGEKSINPDWAAMHNAGLAADQRRNFPEAIDDFQQSWQLARTPSEKGASANDLGQAYRQSGHSKNAAEWLERACGIWRARPDTGHYLAIAASSLSDVYRDEGDYARAEVLLREALAAKNDDAAAPDIIRNALADLLREQGHYTEARQLLTESLRSQTLSWKERVNALTGLADIDQHAGDWISSADEWNEALRIARDRRDEGAEIVASRGLASLWVATGNLSRAEPLFRRTLAILEGNPGSSPDQKASVYSGLAELYRAQNKLALAEDAWTRALAVERGRFGDLHPHVAWMTEMLAEVYAARGDREMAQECVARAVDAIRSLFGEEALPMAAALANRATVEQRLGELDAAALDFERALGIARRQREQMHGNPALEKTTAERYAGLLKSMHRNREAKAARTTLAALFSTK